jgi:hypothetical protein
MQDPETKQEDDDLVQEPPAQKPSKNNNREVAELRQQLAKYSSVDVDRYNALLEKEASAEESRAVSAAQWDALKIKNEALVSDARKQAEEANSRHSAYVVQQELINAFYAQGGVQADGDDPNYYAKTVASQLSDNVRLVDGEVVVFEDGQPTAQSVGDYVASRKSSAMSLFFTARPSAQGSGSSERNSRTNSAKAMIEIDVNDPVAVGKYAKQIVAGTVKFRGM